MSAAVILVTPAELVVLIDAAVRKAFVDAGRPSSSAEWVSLKSCGLPPTTVRRLIKDKHVRGCIVGRALHVHAGDLAKHLERMAVEKVEAPAVSVPEPADEFEAARCRARARRAS